MKILFILVFLIITFLSLLAGFLYAGGWSYIKRQRQLKNLKNDEAICHSCENTYKKIDGVSELLFNTQVFFCDSCVAKGKMKYYKHLEKQATHNTKNKDYKEGN